MTDIVNLHSPVTNLTVIKSSGVKFKRNAGSISGGGMQQLSSFDGDFPNVASENSGSDVAHFSEKLHEEYERGYADAREVLEQQMIERGNEQVRERIESLERIVSQIGKEFSGYKERMERVIPSLAIAVAEKIIRKHITLSNDVIVAQVRDAIRRVVGVEKVRVRINPIDEAVLREHRSLLMQEVDSIQDVIIEADDKIEQGGCIIESEMGNVDARISTQLKQIEDAFQA